MQNRSSVLFFLVLFSLICLYQISFTWVVDKVEKDAVSYSAGDFEKEKFYLDSIGSQEVYNLGFAKYNYKECKEREINLGLDLRGGMNVTLEVSVVDILRALSNNSIDKTFNDAINLAIDKQKSSPQDFIILFKESFESFGEGKKLASVFYTEELSDKINPNSTNEEVIEIIQNEVKDAVDRTFNILRSRIDRFGVTQPNIQKLEYSGRILIELPGVKDPARVKKLLQGTAELAFWETYEYVEVLPYLEKANIYLRDKIESESIAINEEIQDIDISNNDIKTEDTKSLKDELFSSASNGDTLSGESADTSSGSLEDFQKNYPLYAILYPNIDANNNPVDGPVVGVANVKDTAQINDYFKKDSELYNFFPKNLKFAWTVKSVDQEGDFVQLIALKTTLFDPVTKNSIPVLGGEVISDARQDFDPVSNRPVVSMIMNSEGSRDWAKITKENITRSVAILLDGFVYSFPTVQSQITGGSSQISGNFTINEATDLANVLKSGKLPARSKIVEEAIVGPSLGEEAIQAGFKSFVIALSIVLIYMILYYSLGGFVSNIALLANMFFIIGVLASLNAVLTLPGIAGIVLTIGIAVDANVLIYERIREELLSGKGVRLAIADGYNNAYSAIIDANVTTLLTGIILYSFGSGPVKGFATTLVIGILTSLFSAIFITRLVFEARLRKKKNISFYNSITKGAFKNTKINFISKRKIGYIVSCTVILIGVFSMFSRGLNQGVDFQGGRTYVVRFDDKVSNEDIRSNLTNVFVTEEGINLSPEVKTFGDNNQVKITTNYLIYSQDDNADKLVQDALEKGLKEYLLASNINSFDIMSSQKVGPTIAPKIKASAVQAIMLSLVIIFIYILIRFRNWEYSLGAVVAVFHDILFVLGLFSIFYGKLPFSLEINQAFIAALLTIIGYSLNDTVVVFDRIREYFNNSTSSKYDKELVNSALNSTLSRTVNTSLTTFFVLFIIFSLGGEVIRGFMFALLIGVVVGTYSSLFIATPVMYDAINRKHKK